MGLYASVLGACIVANRIPQFDGSASLFTPAQFLPWIDSAAPSHSLDAFREASRVFDAAMAERDARQT